MSFGLTELCMHPTNCALDAVTGPSLLLEELFEPEWLLSIRVCQSPRLKSGTNLWFKVTGAIMLHVRMGESRIRVMFEIFRNLAVPVFLGILLIDNSIKIIFSIKRKIVLFNSPPVPILTVHETEADKT